MGFGRKQQILSSVLLVEIVIICLCLNCESHDVVHGGHHHCHHDHDHHKHNHHTIEKSSITKLPEEIAEEEYLNTHGFIDQHSHHHDHHIGASHLSGVGLWVQALGCSLLVSMASLICLIILPIIFLQGKPSKWFVDTLALFGAGAMLGDAFLHQLPHAFGGEHSGSHDHVHKHGSSTSHSLKDLSVGLSILGGIVLFLLVEKIVRYVEDFSGANNALVHGHHHHHNSSKNLKNEEDDDASPNTKFVNKVNGSISEESSEIVLDKTADGEKRNQHESLVRKRNTATSDKDGERDLDKTNDCAPNASVFGKEPSQSSSTLVFGYLNLFSDGVHNFTDGMALGSAFLLYGSVGGWSRTVFLLAHELPQEVGDFGILVRSGFGVSKALLFNFLSALVALAGTALVLIVGEDSGQSSLIEGFTAGGFIYIAVAGVLADINNNGRSNLQTTAGQLISLVSGMAVALCISLVE